MAGLPNPINPSPLIALALVQFCCGLTIFILSALALNWFTSNVITFLVSMILGASTLITGSVGMVAGFFIQRNWSKVLCSRFVKRSAMSSAWCIFSSILQTTWIFINLSDTEPRDADNKYDKDDAHVTWMMGTLALIFQILLVTSITMAVCCMRTYLALSAFITRTLANYLARVVPVDKMNESLSTEAAFVADFVWTNV